MHLQNRRTRTFGPLTRVTHDGRTLILICTLSLSLVAGAACAPSSSVRKSEPTSTDTISSRTLKSSRPEEVAGYKEIETLFSQKSYETAESKMISFSKKYPESPLLAGLENMRGLLHLQKNLYNLSIRHFQKAVQLCEPSDSYKNYYLYNLASAQFAAHQVEETQSTLNQIQMESLDKVNRVKVYILKANIFEKKGLPLETVRQLLTAGHTVVEIDLADNRTALDQYLDKSLSQITKLEDLDSIYKDYEDSPMADAVLLRLSQLEVQSVKTSNAEAHLRHLLARFPKSRHYTAANDLLSQIVRTSEVNERLVGVLLPMSGKFSRYAAKTLQGLELAFGIFGDKEPSAKFKLIIEDSGEEPEQVIKALNRLVLQHHVIAVVGPLLSKGVDQVAQKAVELGVPLLSLSRRNLPRNQCIFEAGMTENLQAVEMARYAIDNLKLKNFAILFPNDKMGQEITKVFWDTVESMGGKVVGVEGYSPGETDFRLPVDKLSGLFYTNARHREIDALAKERETNKIKKRTRKTEQYFALKPIVDYDAVFIPDEARVAGQIIPTFAYRDVENIKFLGTSSWNSPDFLERTQNYGESASFVEGFFPDSTTQEVKEFVDQYKRIFHQDPGSLDALAFDAGKILYSTLQSSPNMSRYELCKRLQGIQGFPGVTGQITFREGQWYRSLKLISVKDGQFLQVN